MSVTPEQIAAAHEVIKPHVLRTPTVPTPRLGASLDAEMWLKLESLQITGSFKLRGACLKLERLSAAGDGLRGIVAASAGNHAQGVAHHAQRLGIPTTIVMPETTPFSKVERTEAYGAKVLLHGISVADCNQHALALAERDGLEFIHPYDDPVIIAGQGTAALEMLADAPEIDTLVVPIGGGGLAAGTAVWAKHVNPNIRVYGVQTERCPSMHAALAGEPMPGPNTHTLADGIAVKNPGELPLQLLRDRLEEVLLVSESDIEEAVQALAGHQKVVAEGAGAAGYAAMLRHPELFRGRAVGVIICGGNIDRRMLSTVLLRGLKRDGKIAKLRVLIHDVPGVLSRVTQLVGAAGADVIEIDHQRLFSRLPPREAELHVVMETRGGEHVRQVLERLSMAGFTAEWM